MLPIEQLPIPLLEWYRDNARTLPWREDPTPYHVWVSEIMLQQTRVAAVLDYYARFMAEMPDVAALAQVPEGRLMKLWQGRLRNAGMRNRLGENPALYISLPREMCLIRKWRKNWRRRKI